MQGKYKKMTFCYGVVDGGFSIKNDVTYLVLDKVVD
jgi:hypothetical protein